MDEEEEEAVVAYNTTQQWWYIRGGRTMRICVLVNVSCSSFVVQCPISLLPASSPFSRLEGRQSSNRSCQVCLWE